jgi:DNA-binding transcriptional LysR family regulator
LIELKSTLIKTNLICYLWELKPCIEERNRMFRDLNHIPLFVNIVRLRSLSAAADKLHIPVATVSRKLAEMERQSGARLIERSARHFSLTEAGQHYFEKAELLYEQLRDAETLLKQSQSKVEGTIRMTMPVDFGTEFLAQCLTDFIKTHPDVKLELDLSARRVNFTEDDIDLAIRMGPLQDGSQISRNLGTMSRSLYGSPSIAADTAKYLRPVDLGQAKFVLLDSLSPGHLLHLKQRQTEQKLTLTCEGPMRVNAMGMLVRLAVAGAGIGVIPDAVAQPWTLSGQLQRVLPDWQATPVEVHLLYRERALLPKRLRLLISHIQNHLASLGIILHY